MAASGGALAAAAMRQIDVELDWYRELSAEDRSYVRLVAQAGIAAFTRWFADQTAAPSGINEMFAAAPRELAQSIPLRHALQLVRLLVGVVESHASEIAAPGDQEHVREAILRYSREVAFSAAEVYARAAEARGAWDARVEALVVDAVVRGDDDASIPARAQALGWKGHGDCLVVVGSNQGTVSDGSATQELLLDDLRRAARRLTADVLVGVYGHQLVVVLGGDGALERFANRLSDWFGPGPVVTGPRVATVATASRSAAEALAGLRAAPGLSNAPRTVAARDLLPERVLIGDTTARAELVKSAYQPLKQAGGANLATLGTYLDSGRSLEATARTLNVHPNTVRYRLRKVSELSGWDPLEPRDALVLQIALICGRLAPDTTTA